MAAPPAQSLAYGVLVASLMLAVAGVHQYHGGWRQRRAAARRSAADDTRSLTGRVPDGVDAWLRRARAGRRLETRLRAAGMDLPVLHAVGIALGAATVAVLVGRVLVPRPAALAAAPLAVWGCWAYVRHRQTRRRAILAGQLPELARVMANAAAAGLALPGALRLARAELDDPAAAELGRVVSELEVGAAVPEALAGLHERVPAREVGVLVATLAIQQRCGGDVVAALRALTDTLEAREEVRREVTTTMAGAVFSAYLVVALGIGTLPLMHLLTPGVVEQMVTSRTGQLALASSAGLFALGLGLVRTIARVKT